VVDLLAMFGDSVMKRLSLAVFVLLLLVGCGEPRADATNAQTLFESIKKMKANMADEESREFSRTIVFLQKVDPPEEGQPADPRTQEEIVRERIHNKTAAELDATAEALNRARAPLRLREMKESATSAFHNGQRLARMHRYSARYGDEELAASRTSPQIVDRESDPVSDEAAAIRDRNLIAANEKAAAEFEVQADEWREFALWIDETRDIDEAQARYDALILRERRIHKDLGRAIDANQPPQPPAPKPRHPSH
jgi:hypothetical protein